MIVSGLMILFLDFDIFVFGMMLILELFFLRKVLLLCNLICFG